MKRLYPGVSLVLVAAVSVAAVMGACGDESSGSGAATTGDATTAGVGGSGPTATGSGGEGTGGDPDVASSTNVTSGGGECDIAADCDDEDACTDDGCSDGVCNHFAVEGADDDDECTVDTCDPGTGVTHTPNPDIDDGDACTADICDPDTGEVTHTGGGCDDGDVCTTDSCDGSGACVNTADLCGPTYAGVQPIFQAKCTPCHDGGAPESCAGGTCFVNHYAGTQLVLSGGPCDGLLAADCILQDIDNGNMPRGATCTGDPVVDADTFECVLSAEQAAIEQWVGAGAPQ